MLNYENNIPTFIFYELISTKKKIQRMIFTVSAQQEHLQQIPGMCLNVYVVLEAVFIYLPR